MSTSSIETVREEFIDELETINGTGSFRNAIAKVYRDLQMSIPEHPSITFRFGADPNDVYKFIPTDSNIETFQFTIPFYIVCEFCADSATEYSTSPILAAQDSLVHDIHRIVVTLYTKYLNANTPSWHIDDTVPVQTSPCFALTGAENQFAFVVYGDLIIRNLDSGLDQ
ncbi:MAG: hypothetical protein IMZ53_09895 [Thermoplasmata archaeon]|nr:hypothetical protein [Thermoplasmata archaeon]